MTPAEYETLAEAAKRQSATLTKQRKALIRLGTRIEHEIGGSATGEDRAMVGRIATASARAQAAAKAFGDASQAARRAASEALAREAAARRAATSGR